MNKPLIKQAFVLGAGLGTRLRPLTEDLPKPLLPIFQKPLITFALDHLLSLGVETFVINTHHLASRLESLFADGSYAGHEVQLVHEPDILETGGGIKNAESYLGAQPFLSYSGDILTDFDLQPLIEEHFRTGNNATLALRRTGLGTDIILKDGRIVDITKNSDLDGYDYAGVSVWNPEIFQRIPAGKKISFIPVLVEWIRQGGQIGGVVLNDQQWFNIGSRTEYLNVHRTIREKNWKPFYVKESDWPMPVAKNARIEAGAQMRGCSVVAEDCCVGAGAILEDTILWPGSQIASRSELRNCIVRSGKRIEGIHRDADL